MKKKLLYILLIPGIGLLIVLLYVICTPSKEATPSPEEASLSPKEVVIVLPPKEEMPLPTLLTCWEHGSSGHPEPGKINAINGLAADGDLLWISTGQGLARLDVSTWTCDLFTEVDGVSLAGNSALLLDGKGGLWVSPSGYGKSSIALYSDGEWQVDTLGWPRINYLAINQEGQICANGVSEYRHNTPINSCYGNTDGGPPPIISSLDCDLWQRTSVFNSRAECELVNEHRGRGAESLVSLHKDRVWIADGVDALEADPVRGGVWIGSPDGLIYGEITNSGYQVFHPFTLLKAEVSAQNDPYISIQPPFPGDASGLTSDADGRVWATQEDKGVLRYEEQDQAWHQVSLDTSADAIAADPVRGIWVAGEKDLVYLDGEQQRRWRLPDDLRGTTALLIDRGRRVWMGTTRDGVWTEAPLSRPAGSTLDWYRFGREDGLESTLITALAQAPDGRIYAAHHAGVSVFDPADGVEDGRWTTLPDSDVGEEYVWANALAFGSGGDDLWVGYYPSMTVRRYRHVDGRWVDYSLPVDLYQRGRGYYYSGPQKCSQPDPQLRGGVSALLVDDSGTLWAGVTGDAWWQPGTGMWHPIDDGECWPSPGLFRWQAAGEGDPRWQALDPDGGSAELGVLSLAQDTQGRIWVGGGAPVAVWPVAPAVEKQPDSPEPTDVAARPARCLTGVAPKDAWYPSIDELVFSPDGATLAIGTSTGLHLCQADLSAQVWRNADPTVFHLTWSPDGAALAGSLGDTIVVWDAATGKRLRTIKGIVFSHLAWSPDWTTLASRGADGTIILWNAATGERMHTLEGHSSWVNSVAWSPDGATLASGAHDGAIILWDAVTWEQLHTLENQSPVSSVSWSPDGTILVSATEDGTIILWDTARGQPLNTLKGHPGHVSVSWSPDGHALAAHDGYMTIWGAHDGDTITLWDVATGEQQHTLVNRKSWVSFVRRVAWSPDGTKLASMADDDTITLWDVATGEPLRTIGIDVGYAE